MEQKPPYPPKSMLKSREEKNAPFCILDLGGRGGLSVPFKKSEIVVSPEDNVGFTMYEFRLMPGDDFSFAAFYPGQNHIYYCIEGP